jgi:hypothetical protein
MLDFKQQEFDLMAEKLQFLTAENAKLKKTTNKAGKG